MRLLSVCATDQMWDAWKIYLVCVCVCVCVRAGCVRGTRLSERPERECFCETARPPLHSTPALPLNFSSLKVQFVHNLALNDPSFVRAVCVCQWQRAFSECLRVARLSPSRDIAHSVGLVDRSPLDPKVM